MSNPKLECAVLYLSQKKTIFAESFEKLCLQTKQKFSIDQNTSLIFNIEGSEIDEDSFEEYRSMRIKREIIVTTQNLHSSTTIEEMIFFTVLPNNNKRSLSISSLTYLSELSLSIIHQLGESPSKLTCFLYSKDGQPLSPSFESSQFLKIKETIEVESEIQVVLTRNIYDNKKLSIPDYQRRDVVSVIFKYNLNHKNILTNQANDNKKTLKDLIGLKFGIPSSSIQLESEYESRDIRFSVIDYKPKLNLDEYNTLTPQTEKGLRIFVNFLYCLQFHYHQKKDKLLSCIRYLINHNPLLYALNTLLIQQTFMELELVAIEEGFFELFKFLAQFLRLEIPEDQLFENTLEFFSYLFDICEHENFNKHEEIETKAIHVTFKIRDPVIRFNNGQEEIFDKTDEDNLRNEGFDNLKIISNKELKMQINRTSGVERSELSVFRTVFDPDYSISHILRDLPLITSIQDLYTLRKKRIVTQYTSYLDLKVKLRYKTLTINRQSMIVVNCGQLQCSNAILLKDYFKSKDYDPIPSSLSSSHNDNSVFFPELLKNSFLSNVQKNFSRNPEEAIAVIIDSSGSMLEPFQESGKNRLAVVKDLFNSFVNRTIGYNLPQVISLATFSDSVVKISDFTEDVYRFCDTLDKIDASGRTSLYDAIFSACENLVVLQNKYQQAKLRIICFSDGYDNNSSINEMEALKNLIEKGIVFDSVNIVNNCYILKNLSFASGGFAFCFDSIDQGFSIFESDAFISLSFRHPAELLKINSANEIKLDSLCPFTEIPPPIKYPGQLNLEVSELIASLMTFNIIRSKFSSSLSSLRFKRINREMVGIHKNPHPDIEIYPCDLDIQFWNGILHGPCKTAYESGNFQFYILFPEEYPYKPPEIRFVTKLFHLNINSSGRICISVLNNDYSPEYSIRKLLDSIYGLFMNPEDEDSIETNSANLYRNSKERYFLVAQDWTKRFAGKSVEEILRGVKQKEVQSQIPKEFLCSLSHKIMEDPVTVVSSKITYEKCEIEKFIRQHGIEPFTKQPVSLNDLFPEKHLLIRIQEFKKYCSGSDY